MQTEACALVKALRYSYITVTLLSQYFGEVRILTDDIALAAPHTIRYWANYMQNIPITDNIAKIMFSRACRGGIWRDWWYSSTHS